MEHFPIIIVGAGPAGIAAATRLLENGVQDFIILEAENRIGGRVFTSQMGNDLIELGAEWIHGNKDNVVYEMASEYGLAKIDTQETIFTETTFYESENRQVDKEISRELCKIYEKIVYIEQDQVKTPQGSLGDYFMNEFRNEVQHLRNVNINEKLLDKFIDVFQKWENSIDASDSWFETSLAGHFEYWECDGNKITSWKKDGYKSVFDLLQNKYAKERKALSVTEKIKFEKEVTKIMWNRNAIQEIPNVIIECQDGKRFSADQVILTFSLGVLKDKAKHMFIPALSQSKLHCIDGLGFGTVDKIFLKFSHPWWTQDEEGFSFLWSEEERNSDTSGWISDVIAFHPINEESSILRGWIIGKAARLMEALSNEEVLDGCMSLLYKFLGFKYNIPRAECVARTTWYHNPHFRGSYSCRLLKSDKNNVWASDLAHPECNTKGKPLLLFAGEASHDHYYSTVHGAIETGRREADRLLKKNTDTSDLKKFYEVVIVGAGISGLAAAKTLCDEGITDVIVLEAQEKPGGRIQSLQIEGNWLELGAQWIHGDKNGMHEMCVKHDLLTSEYSEEGQGLYLRENGSVIDDCIVREMDDLIKDILESCEDYINCGNNTKIPQSVGEELVQKFNEYLNSCNDLDDVKDIKKDLFQWHIRFQLIDNSCDDVNALSAKAWGLYKFCGGNDYINFKRGYTSLVDAMINEIDKCNILCSMPVKLVTWNEWMDAENYMNQDVNSPRSNDHNHRKLPHGKNCAEVICNNDVSFDTNYVIVTSSLGYLKKKYKKMFHPPLPAYLTKAIESLGFGVLGKIFLIYDEPWWEPDVKGFQLIWSRGRYMTFPEDNWAVDITGFDVIMEKKPILLGWIGGRGARIIENMSDSDLGQESTEILRKFTGNKEIPFPSRVIKSKWFSNEYVCGGYSHITVNYDVDGIDGSCLTQPVFTNVTTKATQFKKPTILLAGEAAHQLHFSTVHGAYESGVSQARVVAEDMKKRRKNL